MRARTGDDPRVTRRVLLAGIGGLVGTVALAACGGAATGVTTSSATAATTAPSTASRATSAAAVSQSSATTTASASSSAPAASAAASIASASASQTTATSVPASATAPGAGVVTINHLDWWQPNTPVLVTFFNGNKADFEAKYPNVRVNYLYAPSSTDVREKWIVMATGGTPPDTSQVATLFIRDLVRGQLAEPLDAYIAKTPEMAMSNFVSSALFSNQMNGHVYGIPFDGPQILIIAYNADHFQEAGLDPSKDFTWKWTTEQFLDAANKLNRVQSGKTTRGGMMPFAIQPRGYSGWLYANGGDFYNEDYTKTLINSPEGRNALQLCQDLWTRYPFQVAGNSNAAFETEDYSMTYTGSYTAGYILDKNPKLKFLFAPLPKGPLAKSPGSMSFTNMYSMARAGTKKDAAWEWVSWVNSEQAQEKYFAEVQKRPSARKAVYQSAAWAAVVKEQPAVDGVETLVPETKEFPWIAYDKVQNDTGPIWTKVQKGQMTPSDALNQMEPIINTDIAGQ